MNLKKVRMALPKAVGFVIVLLAIIYSLEHQGYRTSLNVFVQKLMGTKASNSHAREKRVASLESSVYVFQAVLDLSDLDRLRANLSTNPVITLIDGLAVVSNIKATTVCYSNGTDFQCRCEESLAWSYNNCITYGACDAIIGDTCGCINALPVDDQYCQTNSTPPVTVDADLILEVNIPVSSLSPFDINVVRDTLRLFSFPYTVNQTLKVTGVNLTTVCNPNSTGALQCQCEEQFAWSCDQCNTYGVCGNLTTLPCGCIHGLPSDGGLCEPITSIAPCPTSPPFTVDADLILEVNIPVSSLSSFDLNVVRETLRLFSFHYTVNQTFKVTGVNLTTVCNPNSTGALQCQCEEQFAWSCDQCNTYGVCGNLTTLPCGCIHGLPSDGGLCEPITSIAPCPTSPPFTVDADLILEVNIPVSSLSPYVINVVRDTLRVFSFPYTVNQTLKVTGVNLTTVCNPNSTGALQCQCEEQFAWSCDQCNTYGVCGNLTTLPCGCIHGLPSDGGLCEPITSIAPCPTSPPFTVDADLILEVNIPVSSLSPYVINVVRDTLRVFSFPYTVNQTLKVTGVNLTTVCNPNSTGALQCQCEEQFAWSCEQCNTYGVCGNLTTLPCGCIHGLPSDGGLCEPITSIAPCPTSPPFTVDADLILEVNIPVSSLSSFDINVVRDTLRLFSFPYTVNQTLKVTGVNLTTVCNPNSTGALQCQCEEQFAWSCDQCNTYGVCGNLTTLPCGCIHGLPSDGGLCEPITSIAPCPTSPPFTVDADLILEVNIPVSSLSSFDINVVRDTLRVFSFPYTVNQTLKVTGVNLTTVCNPNSTGALQCQCEEQFAWSCDQCNTYGVCGNLTTLPCGCIHGLPSDGGLCEPITSIAPCPVTTTTTMTPTPTSPRNITINTTITPTSTPSTNTTITPTSTPTTNTTMTPTSTPSTNTTITPTSSPTTNTTITPTSTPTTNTTITPTSTPTTNTTITPTSTPSTNTTIRPTSTATTNTTMTPMPAASTTPIAPSPTMTPIVEERKFSFVMDLDYDPAFNNPSNNVYQAVNDTIQEQSRKHISTFKSATLTRFRSGSTIVDYSVTATSFGDSEIKALEIGVFTKLAENFTMIFDSPTSIQFDPPFLGRSVTLTCGPIPTFLNFSGSWTAEWRHNGDLISEDSEHSFAKTSEGATLTVSRFIEADNGEYECRLKEGSIFRQKSNKVVFIKDTPLVQVRPLRQKVKCEVGKDVLLMCSVNSPYKVEFKDQPIDPAQSITFSFKIEECPTPNLKFTCQAVNSTSFKNEITLEFSTGVFLCDGGSEFGVGNLDERAEVSCGSDEVGKRIAECQSNGTWKVVEENCVLKLIQDLLDQSQFLTNNSLAAFLRELRNVTLRFRNEVVESSPNINATVEILNNVANITSSSNILINETEIEDILFTSGVLTEDESKQQWDFLNTKSTAKSLVTNRNVPKAKSASSIFLLSLERITTNLNNNSFEIATPSIILNKTTFTDNFSGDFNSSVEIDIPEANGRNKSITVMTFSSMDNVLPPRDKVNSTLKVINGKVTLVQSSGTVNNISFAFDIINDTLGNPQCVFWNFSLFDGLGGWDDKGCKLTFNVNNTVTCTCNHLTSFSILMSPFAPDSPVLDYITYAGVVISMVSLVICLIIEAVIWRKIRKSNTSYLRHVSIVNIALSLLIANIWFIIAAAISDADVKNKPACIAATFFIHLFYLALFFWMLASALLLLYRTVSVFGGDLSKHALLAIGFCMGYGAPLIIAIVTIAVTAPSGAYIRETGVCWLNWNQSKALLAFVIPALVIVVINLGILLVVLYKMLRRRAVVDASQAAEKNAVVVIARTVAFLTPFFGLTWGLGVGTMTDPHNEAIHISFAFFNSLQGFFILLFGTLLDKKVRSEIALMSQTSASGTRSTSGGTSSSNGLGIFRLWRRGRDGYNLPSNESGASHSYVNT
ncbi:adhesion G protein-coupled receptor F5-like isoform X2 [Paralichthys olivaceus]|uniref:adhesion G protein-coupled receptor F5-like isoform X2 n=2 Tax=Paralichthys olivaceus TaxID=8255 RepID=UPI003751693E